jgi:uncharacterized RDD family membrane protein YckC
MVFLSSFVVGWLYGAGMESSSYQATLGKMAMGLKVTDAEGKPITFLHATGRHLGKYAVVGAVLFGELVAPFAARAGFPAPLFAMLALLAWLICLLGYVMILFNRSRRGLHDILAGTLVPFANTGVAGTLPDVTSGPAALVPQPAEGITQTPNHARP